VTEYLELSLLMAISHLKNMITCCEISVGNTDYR